MSMQVGSYIVSETLGYGAFGKVKLAVHKESKAEFAIKILEKSDIKVKELTPSMRREIAIMKALNHRNIVGMREVLNGKHKLFIVMDLVRGSASLPILDADTHAPNESAARGVFQQLVNGVEYCHQRGIYHRDIKPENLLLSADGTLKITDFGVNSMKAGTVTDQLLYTSVGTPFYAAPELLGDTKAGYQASKVDVWSVGVILYLLLTGTLPFQSENMTALYNLINQANVSYPPDFPPDAKDLLSRMLVRDPERRIDLAAVKEHPWFLVDYTPDLTGTKSLGASAPHFTSQGSSELLAGGLPPGVPRRESQLLAAPRRESQLSELGGFGVKNVVGVWGEKEFGEFVRAAAPGKPEKKVQEIVEKLSAIDIDCVSDLQAVADEQKTTEGIKAWLEGNSIPSVTALRLANMFKA
mmetsp:Transcript_5402/g.12995  ORF Transcript_5402/g.12995 Transcript_5402/m.12995 type:complete len:412 (+) Transcript_5402:202-1437(+)